MSLRKLRLGAGVLVAYVCAAGSAQAQAKRTWKKAWLASAASLVTVNVMDAHSSVGRYETNPLLRDPYGRFSPGKAVAVKSAASGGLLLVQYLLLKKRPDEGLEKAATVVNFAAAAAVGAVAYRNTKVPR